MGKSMSSLFKFLSVLAFVSVMSLSGQAQDEVDEKRDELLGDAELRLRKETTTEHLFTIRWELT